VQFSTSEKQSVVLNKRNSVATYNLAINFALIQPSSSFIEIFLAFNQIDFMAAISQILI
jgi:hypothetical protein